MKRSLAVATESAAEHAAEQALEDGGTASDAVAAGFFAAAGQRAGALLGPIEMLVGGLGVGARAFDGRPRQPGLGAPRPRGFTRDQAIAPAAWAAVPCSLGALSLLRAYDGKLPFGRLVRAGVELAEGAGATDRAEMIERVGRRGAAVLRDRTIVRALVTAGGRSEHGLLTARDLDVTRPVSEAALARAASDPTMLLCPWSETSTGTGHVPAQAAAAALRRGRARPFEVVLATDQRGVVAALAYRPDDDGIAVDGTGVALTRDAAPVERGITRLAPGSPLGPSSAIALVAQAAPFAAVGVKSDGGWLVGRARWPVDGSPLTRETLAALCRGAAGTRAVAVMRSPDSRRAAGKLVWSEDVEP